LKDLLPLHIVWLLPLAFIFHLLEEYFADPGLAAWISDFFDTDLSINDFIFINAIAFGILFLFAITYTFWNANNMILLAIGTLFFVNGIIHLLASLYTLSYVPGIVTGLVIYIPLGLVVFKKIVPLLSEKQAVLGISIGILIQFVVMAISSRI